MYLLAIWISSLEKCPFLMGLFVFLLLSGMSLIPITHRFHTCKFAYRQKCICSPQNKHSAHIQGHSQTCTGWCETLLVQWPCPQLSSKGALFASTSSCKRILFEACAGRASLFSLLCFRLASLLVKTNPRCS